MGSNRKNDLTLPKLCAPIWPHDLVYLKTLNTLFSHKIHLSSTKEFPSGNLHKLGQSNIKKWLLKWSAVSEMPTEFYFKAEGRWVLRSETEEFLTRLTTDRELEVWLLYLFLGVVVQLPKIDSLYGISKPQTLTSLQNTLERRKNNHQRLPSYSFNRIKKMLFLYGREATARILTPHLKLAKDSSVVFIEIRWVVWPKALRLLNYFSHPTHQTAASNLSHHTPPIFSQPLRPPTAPLPLPPPKKKFVLRNHFWFLVLFCKISLYLFY